MTQSLYGSESDPLKTLGHVNLCITVDLFTVHNSIKMHSVNNVVKFGEAAVERSFKRLCKSVKFK
jgi:hypothetical protein